MMYTIKYVKFNKNGIFILENHFKVTMNREIYTIYEFFSFVKIS